MTDEEMAKEYQIRKHHQRLYGSKPVVMKELNTTYKDGFNDGYNKANEWHYVKDEGTPKVEGHYLVCLRNKDRDIFDCWIYYDKDVGWYSMKVRMKDIYAWKEIVLPKESKTDC
jgi:hypothetical protein